MTTLTFPAYLYGWENELTKRGFHMVSEYAGEGRRFVRLPPGWLATPSDETTNLFDDRGRHRGSVIGYDRGGFNRLFRLDLVCRYQITFGEGPRGAIVLDTKCPMHAVPEPLTHNCRFGAREAAVRLARAWLDVERPSWRHPFSYW